jgi:hypothetical protein
LKKAGRPDCQETRADTQSVSPEDEKNAQGKTQKHKGKVKEMNASSKLKNGSMKHMVYLSGIG